MKRALLAPILLLAACSGTDSFTPTPEQEELADCTALNLGNFSVVYGGVIDLFEVIPGAPPGGTYDIADGDYTLATTLGSVVGVVSSADNISDGIDVNESATATWELNGGLAGTSVTGEGTLTVARPSSSVFNVSGSGGLLDGTCEFTFTNLSFTINATTGLTGTVLFTVDAPAGTISGTMTFNGSTKARVVATLSGVTYAFYIDLITFDVTY